MHVGCLLGTTVIVIGAVAAWQALCTVVKALSTAQAVIGTSGGSDSAPGQAEDIKAQREELWRKAAAQRKKFVRVVGTRDAEDGPSKGDLLWARAVFYLLRWAKQKRFWNAGGTALRFLAERSKAIKAQIDREARDVGA